MGLLNVNSFSWRKCEEGTGRLCRFSISHRKGKNMEAFVEAQDGRIYRFWGGHRKVEYLKALFSRSGGYGTEMNY